MLFAFFCFLHPLIIQYFRKPLIVMKVHDLSGKTLGCRLFQSISSGFPNKFSCLCPLLSFSQRGRNRNKLLLDFEVLGPKRWRDFQKCFVNELQRTRDAKKRSVTEPCMITAKANLLIDPCLTFEQL